jgi:hypothetical protein
MSGLGGTEEERAKRIAEAEFMRERGLWAPGAGPWNDGTTGPAFEGPAGTLEHIIGPALPYDYEARCLALDIAARVHKEYGDADAILEDSGRFLAFLLAKPPPPLPGERGRDDG